MLIIGIIACMVVLLFVRKGDDKVTILKKVALGIFCAVVVILLLMIGSNFIS